MRIVAQNIWGGWRQRQKKLWGQKKIFVGCLKLRVLTILEKNYATFSLLYHRRPIDSSIRSLHGIGKWVFLNCTHRQTDKQTDGHGDSMALFIKNYLPELTTEAETKKKNRPGGLVMPDPFG